MRRFVRWVRLESPAECAFSWHERPGALERLMPPWEDVDVLYRSGGIRNGARVLLRQRIGPLRLQLAAEHSGYEPPRRFVDELVAGPFSRWRHEHVFHPEGERSCRLEDSIDYRLPLHPLSTVLAGGYVDRKLDGLFRYRHEITKRDVEAACAYRGRRMKILITGATGLIGSALWPLLSTAGHSITGLRRRGTPDTGGQPWWDPASGAVDEAAIGDADAIIHLAGENIAARRWSAGQRDRIRQSRVEATRRLCEWLAARPVRPGIFISASAIGLYGDRGDAWLDEQSEPGSGFLADLGCAWENSTEVLEQKGVRVVHLRTGLVLTPRGGALSRMLPPFRLGLGGRLGSGRQYQSWIDIEDHIRAIQFALTHDNVSGPINLVAPHPVTNREFVATLGRVLRRPTLLPVPAGVLRLVFGPMADEALLASARVRPTRLLGHGFEFLYPELDGSLRHLLGRP